MVDVSAALMLPRSTCSAKKARPRMGSRIKSTLVENVSECAEVLVG